MSIIHMGALPNRLFFARSTPARLPGIRIYIAMMFLPERQTHFDLSRRRGVTPATMRGEWLSIWRLFNVAVVIRRGGASSLLDHCHSRYECSATAGKIPQCKIIV